MDVVPVVRAIGALLCAFLFAAPVGAANAVTVAQLEQFLTSKKTLKQPDEEIAEQLSQVSLSEELNASTVARILSVSHPGPRTTEQIELLAGSSVFKAPPTAQLPHDPAPDLDSQRKMVEAARVYVNGTLRQLPDFLSVRVTRCFDNSIVDSKPRDGKPKALMHLVREYRRGLAYRSGREVEEPVTGAEAAEQASEPGLTTWGEFGGMLKVVLDDAFNGSVTWERWQRSDVGAQVAVFRYAIPAASSHYSVDFCCYQESKENPESLSFHAKPGYHGEIQIDPVNGAVERVTLEAELKPADPVRTSAIAVVYGGVDIGGKTYICPIRGVAMSVNYSLVRESVDGVGLERSTNLVKFANYHKFGSSSRILTGASGSAP